MHAYKTAIILLLWLPLIAAGQVTENELRLPGVAEASIAIKLHSSFLQACPYHDTEAVFLIGQDGYSHTGYFGAAGSCNAKDLYWYQAGRLVRTAHFSTIDPHGFFAHPEKHSHRLVSEDTWQYTNGKLAVARHTSGAAGILTHEVHYGYDGTGRITTERHYYPRQSLIYYPAKRDFVQYRYAGDSVFRLEYCQGMQQDSFAYLERHNPAGLVTEFLQVSKDGKHFDRELKHYDSSGRITVYESISDRPAVRRDGVVLRADRVEYYYDEQGRPYETSCFARGIKRWSYQYAYLK